MQLDLKRWLGNTPEPLARICDARIALVARPIEQGNWPVVALPQNICDIYQVPLRERQALLDGCLLFFLAADVIDDAQDGDLPPDVSWPGAVNAGNALLFAAIGAFAAAAPGAGVAAEVARSGGDLTSGQALDLISSWSTPLSEGDVLASVRLKSGASARLYTRMAALAARQPDEIVQLWGTLGELWGTVTQLRSDMLDIRQGASRDIKNQKATLPFAYAFARDRASMQEATTSGEPSALRAVLRASGALAFVDLTIDSLVFEIEQTIARLSLSESQQQQLKAMAASGSAGSPL